MNLRKALASPRVRGLAAVFLVGVLAVLAPFANAPGQVIADARYEHSADPAQFLARHASIWDDERSLGAPTEYFSPVLPIFQSVVQKVGGAPWVVQRSTHALLFFLAGLGTMLFARLFSRRESTWALAGLLYAFNPYTSQALLPSGLFMAYVAAPWLALAVYQGLRPESDRWRWAAVFALGIFCLGSLNLPSLILGLTPAVGVAVLQFVTNAPRWRPLWGFAWRTVLLTGAATAAMLSVLSLGRDVVRTNLLTTETPEAVAASSSASETWRGLGNWLSYLHAGGDQVRDHAAPYFTNELVIGCSFLALVLAGYGLVVRNDRRLALLAMTASVSVVLMVGIFPAENLTPFSRALGAAFDSGLFMRGFRNMYKAGPGLQLPVAVLAAVGLTTILRQLRPGSWLLQVLRLCLGGALLFGLAVASFPFWTGNLYPSAFRHEEIPDYWDEAFSWFDEQPIHHGVLILPSAARTPYRWGFVNDTLFDAYLQQPAVSARTLPQSTAALADLTESIEEFSRGSAASPGTLAPILRRIGVRWVLLQNDLDWFFGGLPRPSQYDFIRTDPAFQLVASFGEQGENVVGPVSLTQRSAREGALPPVEVYEVDGASSLPVTQTDSIVVIEGAGDSWPSLSEAGWLTHGVVYAGDLDAGVRADVLDTAAAYVVTDGAQRRAQRVFASQSVRSPVLGLDDDVGREPLNLFSDPGSQTVAEYNDVASVSASHFGHAFAVWERGWKPANAIDGDQSTAWATELTGQQTLAVRLAQAPPLHTLRLWLYDGADDGEPIEELVGALSVEVTHRDGSTTVYVPDIGSGEIVVELGDPAPVEKVEVSLTRVRSVGGLVGVTEMRLEGPGGTVDGTEVLRTPGPLDKASEVDLLADLGTTPTHHLFKRLIGPGDRPEEALLRRKFWSPEGTTDVTSLVLVDRSTPDPVIDWLVASEVSASSTSRYDDDPEASARNLLDGNIATAWQFDRGESATASIRVPGYEVDEIQLWLVASGSLPFELSRVRELSVRIVDDQGARIEETIRLGDEAECDPSFARLGDEVCIERIVLQLPVTTVTEITIEPTPVKQRGAIFNRPPVQLSDVVLLRRGDPLLTDEVVAPSTACREMFRMDGTPLLMRPQAVPTLGALQEGVLFQACDPVELSTGWHRLDAVPDTAHAISRVGVAPTGSALSDPVTTWVDVTERTATSRRVSLTVEAGDIVISDVPFHRGWEVWASVEPGQALAVDGFVAWAAANEGSVELDLAFGPQRRYRLAWFVSAAAIAVCLWLVIPTRRRAS